MSHNFRPSHHLSEINTLHPCHPSCLLFHPGFGFLPFFLSKFKLVLNWESVSRTCRAANTGYADCGGGGWVRYGHHLQR